MGEVTRVDAEQLKERTNNLEVSEFMLDLTKCPNMLMERGADVGTVSASGSGGGGLAGTAFQACFNTSGAGIWSLNDLRFADPRLAASTGQLSPEGKRQLLRSAITLFPSASPPSLVQTEQPLTTAPTGTTVAPAT